MVELAFAAVGSWVGGSFFGSAALGWAIGSFIGSQIVGGADQEGPRLGDLRISTSTYDKDIHRIYGRIRTAGNIIYANEIDENWTRYRVGGIFGVGGTKVTEYTYSATFAIALCEGEVSAIHKIWADSDLVYDADSAYGIATPHHYLPDSFEFHYGTETQSQSEILQRHYGTDIPAHRGLCYLVFEDWLLTDFGNRIPNITVELTATPQTVGTWPTFYDDWAIPPWHEFSFTVTAGNLIMELGCRAVYRFEDGLIKIGDFGYKSRAPIVGQAWAGWYEVWYELDGTKVYEAEWETDKANFPNDMWIYRIKNSNNVFLIVDRQVFAGQFKWHWATKDGVLSDAFEEDINSVIMGPWSNPPFLNGTNQPDIETLSNAGRFLWVGGYVLLFGQSSNVIPGFGPSGWNFFACPSPDNIPAIRSSYSFETTGSGTTWVFSTEDITQPIAYILCRDGLVGGRVTDGATLVKYDIENDLILDSWYSPTLISGTGWVHGSIVYKDKFIVANDYLGGTWTLRIWELPEDRNADWIEHRQPPWDGISSYLPIGAEGLFRVADVMFSLATTAYASTVTLDTIVTDLCDQSDIDAADIDVIDLASTTVRGYAITKQESARRSIETLQTGFIFDVVESDWKLNFKLRRE